VDGPARPAVVELSVYLLDTDSCIYYLEGRAPELLERLKETAWDDLGVTAVTAGELRYGALHSARPNANLARVEAFLSPLTKVPFDDQAASHYARIKQALTAAGRPIGGFDMLIAATALANDATLITNNVREFSRVPGLRVENWSLP